MAQREKYLLENRPFELKIIADWDVSSANYLTKKLYEQVSNGVLTFELRAKKGSVITEFIVNITNGIISAVLYDLIKIIFNKIKQNKMKGKQIKPIHIFTLQEEYIITGDENSKIPEDMKKELF